MLDSRVHSLLQLLLDRLHWKEWEKLIEAEGIHVERPSGSVHPSHPEIVYPIDYGYVPGTLGTEGDELDIFVGSATNGLVAAIITTDYRRGDRECKLIYNAAPAEIYLVNGFINFDRSLMHGELIMRYPMQSLWQNLSTSTR